MNKYFSVFAVPALILAIILPALALGQATISASITAPSSSSFVVGEDISFAAAVSGGTTPYSVTWNFGDGTSAFGENYTKAYSAAGAYTVMMTASDFDGIMQTDSMQIRIVEPTTPFTASILEPNDGANLNVLDENVFRAIATGGVTPYSFTWNFGDGTSASGDAFSKTYNATGTYAVMMTASDFDGQTVTKNISVNVLSSVVLPQPTLTFTANGSTGTVNVSPTSSTTLAWSTTNATSCSASGDWTGTKATSGSESVGPFAAGSSKTFTLTCTGSGGSTSSTITLSTSGGSTTSLVISNVRVTDVTKNSAIVRWDTNLPANSRVIYDTVSHPDISSFSAPNYGYSSSTGTDSTLVTTHAVTVTGLSANTKYYFRVISEN